MVKALLKLYFLRLNLQGKNANDEMEELRIEIGKWSIENAANLGKPAYFMWPF